LGRFSGASYRGSWHHGDRLECVGWGGDVSVSRYEEEDVKKMETDVDVMAKGIGQRLREIRKENNVTLVELAQSSGVDSATISRIETGKMTGTLESHVRLAAVLGVKLSGLYEGVEETHFSGATIQEPASRSDVYVHQAGKSSITMLTADVLKKKLMPVLITIEPGGSTHQEEAKVGTEKFLYVLDGEIEAKIGEQVYHLKQESTLYFEASTSHSLSNPGDRPAKCLSVVTPPVL